VTPAGLTPGDAQPSSRTEPLDLRVSRLEDAVAHLQDTRQLEERLAERVTNRLKKDPVASRQDATGITANAGRHTAAPEAQLANAQANAAAHPEGDFLVRLRRTWFLYEAYAEVRTIIRMFFDRRYRVSWQCKVIPLVLVFFFLSSWFWIPFTSILPWFIVSPMNKTIDLVLAFLLFKFLAREASRYRAFLAEVSAASSP